MKKYILKIILLSVFLINTCITILFGQTQVTRYTPNGSSVRAYNNFIEMSSQDMEDISNQVATLYPQATELYPHSASTSFNCHAYAWHISEGGDKVWIGKEYWQEADEDIYWTDGSYNNQSPETGCEKISYYRGNHSAVQTPTQGIYISKWGAWPVMRHARHYGPTIYKMGYRRYYKLSANSCREYYENKTITTNTNKTGCILLTKNITVKNNSKLLIDASQYTIINGPFEVKLGSTLEVK